MIKIELFSQKNEIARLKEAVSDKSKELDRWKKAAHFWKEELSKVQLQRDELLVINQKLLSKLEDGNK